MKKLMIAAAVVCAAALSHAAMVSWDNGDGDVYTFVGVGETSTTKASGYVAYFFSTLDVDAGSIAAALNSDLAGTLAKGYICSDGTSSNGYLEESTGVDVVSFDAIKGDGGTGYLVIFNGSAATTADHFYVTPTDTEPIAEGVGMFTSFYFDASSSATGSNWTAVAPEPTSGLLLLIGMAGLALRRRRD